MIPLICLVGRPNMGKSTLFNRLVGTKNKMITSSIPGVTRDRQYQIIDFEEWGDGENSTAILIDTGGLYPEKIPELIQKDYFFNIMADATKKAVSESRLVLLVMDITEGLHPFDLQMATMLREQNKQFWAVVNKCDTQIHEDSLGDFYSLGLEVDEIFPVSAAHGRGVENLRDCLHKKLVTFTQETSNPPKSLLPEKDVIGSIAIVGTPNVGKSTLLNRLLDEERTLISPIPGTTVDPVEGHFNLHFKGKIKGWHTLKIVDTAGIRRKKTVKEFVELQAVYRALHCISSADMVIFLVDASKFFHSLIEVERQDRRLIQIALEKGKSVIICLNKIDRLPDLSKKEYSKWLHSFSSYLPEFCDIIPISARDGTNFKQLLEAIKKTITVRSESVSTGKLNKVLKSLVEQRPVIPKGAGTPLKIKYASQIRSSPPTFLLFCNRSRNIPENYRRYLQNRLRVSFQLDNTPIHLIFDQHS